MARHPVVIIGAGMAGFAVARELKQQGCTQEVLLLTADEGGFYAKPLLSHGLSRAKPALSLVMPAEKSAAAHQVRIVPHARVVAVDPLAHSVTVEDGRTFEYDKLVVATGARALSLWSGERVFSVNSAQDMARMEPALAGAQDVLIAGAGFVGLEFANDWAKAGKTVTVASMAGPLRPLLPEAVSQWVERRLANAGVRFERGALDLSAASTLDSGPAPSSPAGKLWATLDGRPLEPAFDLMLSAIGVGANVELWAAAGLATSRNGVVVNNRFETSAADIYALGDAIDYQGRAWRFVAPLNHAAKVIAANLSGTETRENFGVLGIALKCPDAPLAMVLPAPGAAGTWELQAGLDDALEIEAHFRHEGKLLGFVLGGAGTARKKQLEMWVAEVA